MHNNFYFLRRLSARLKQDFNGFVMAEIFSQAKNELIITLLKGGKQKFIRAHLDPSFCVLSFPNEHKRARKNSVDLFQEAVNRKILDVVQIKNDRSFYFMLEDNYRMLFKMHGNKANIILLKGDAVTEIFRKKLKQDESIIIEGLNREVKFDKDTFISEHGNIRKIFPTMGKPFEWHFSQHHYDQMSFDEQYSFVESTLEYLKNPTFFIHLVRGRPPALTVFRMSEEDVEFDDPLLALNELFRLYISSYQLEKRKESIRSTLLRKIRKAGSYIQKSYEKLEKLENSIDYRILADLIMANLHAIRPHEPEVILTDFYSRKPIVIKLNPNITPQANAERYYKKARNQRIEIENITRHIFAREKQLNLWQEQIARLDEITSFKDLKMISAEPEKVKEQEEMPYHRFEFMDHEILVGKNATKNDLLTFKFARKDDMFLHVKDAPGSHVIIRKKSGQNVPEAVIEAAAELAAKYSRRSGESLVPVLYTSKKHVRKAKGGPKGAVIVEREKVLLVKPAEVKK